MICGSSDTITAGLDLSVYRHDARLRSKTYKSFYCERLSSKVSSSHIHRRGCCSLRNSGLELCQHWVSSTLNLRRWLSDLQSRGHRLESGVAIFSKCPVFPLVKPVEVHDAFQIRVMPSESITNASSPWTTLAE